MQTGPRIDHEQAVPAGGSAGHAKMLTDFALLAGERVLQPLIGLFLIGSIARNYSPGDFALWQIAFAMLAVFGVIVTIPGERVVLPKLCMARPDQYESVWKTALVARIVCGFSVAALFLVAGALRQQAGLMPILLVYAVMLVLTEPLALPVAELNAKQDFRTPIVVRLMALSARLGLLILFVELGVPLWVLATSWFAEQFVFIWKLAPPRALMRRWRAARFEWREVRQLLVNGSAIAFAVAGAMAMTRIDRLIFQSVMPQPVLVGNGAAMTIIESAFGMGGTLAILTGSHFLFRIDGIRWRAHLGSIAFSVTVGLVGAIVLYFCAPIICRIVYGQQIAALAAPALQLAAGLLPLFFAVLVVQLPLQSRASNRYLLARGIVTFSVSVSVGWWLVQQGRFELISLGAYAGFACALIGDSIKLISHRDQYYAH